MTTFRSPVRIRGELDLGGNQLVDFRLDAAGGLPPNAQEGTVTFLGDRVAVSNGNGEWLTLRDASEFMAVGTTLDDIPTATGNVDLGGNQIVNLADPTADGHAVTARVMDQALTGLGTQITGLTDDLDAEVTRATAAEAALDGRIDTLETNVSGNVANQIQAETTRATAAEAALGGRIDDVEGDLAAEVTRATGAETALGGRVDDVEGDLAAEVARATGAETALDNRVDGEVTRATGAETALGARIDGVEGDVTAETTRATAAEGALGGRIDGVEADLTTETNRATAAEDALDGRVDAEVARATAAEGALDGRVDTLEARTLDTIPTAAGPVDLDGQRITNVGDPQNPGDAVNYGAVGQALTAISGQFNTAINDANNAIDDVNDDLQAEITRATTEEAAIRADFAVADTAARGYVDAQLADIRDDLAAGGTDAAAYVDAREAAIRTDIGGDLDTLDTQLRAYADAVAMGLDAKRAVRAASEADENIGAPGAAVGGVTLDDGDRVLLMGQADPADNGIYVLAGGALARAEDADDAGDLRDGSFVFVQEGDLGNTGWVQITNGDIVIGTTAQEWTQFSGPGVVTAGTGIEVTGVNVVNIDPAYPGQASITTVGAVGDGTWEADPIAVEFGGTGSANAADARTALGGLVRVRSFTLGNGTDNVLTAAHNLGTVFVKVEVIDLPTGETIFTTVRRTDANTVQVELSDVPAANTIGVVVEG